MTGGHVAVIDIGKTNAKLALVRLSDLSEVALVRRPNTVLPGPPYPHFDVEGHWAFLLDGLARFHAEHGIAAVTVTTHGAAGALIGRDGSLAAPILDYEYAGPDAVADIYDAIRPPFSQTGSPRLPLGLNLGAQIHWQFQTDPSLRDRVHRIVTYPQFWAHRLSGVFATDITCLGAHTDLWNPFAGRFSSLIDALDIADRIAPPRRPGDILGPIAAAVAARTGLPAGTPVHCGIHDSNASLLPHLLGREPPFSVVSTGTWVIAMAVGGRPVALDPARDTLVNVNALGEAVPSARFMGGREHDLALGGTAIAADEDAMRDVLTQRIMLLPALVSESGPFAGSRARWCGGEPAQGTAQRAAAGRFLPCPGDGAVPRADRASGPGDRRRPVCAQPAISVDAGCRVGRARAADGQHDRNRPGGSVACGGRSRPKTRAGGFASPAAPMESLFAAYARDWNARTSHG
jgi:sugar (pentulose or hexulose) kinase